MNREIYIFGAHSRARTLGAYLSEIEKEIKILAYLVDNNEQNPNELEGIPVLHLGKNPELKIEVPVYLGVRGVYHKEITERLYGIAMKNVIPVTQEMDRQLRNLYVKEIFRKTGRIFLRFDMLTEQVGEKLEETTSLKRHIAKIYVAKSVYDKPLEKTYELEGWEKWIQVGSGCTESQITECACFDNTGDNISLWNKQFCELTGLYWIWKNATEDIVGLCHYRRHFLLKENWSYIMEQNKVDVILPVPLFVAPSLGENYRMRHTENTWNAMCRILGRDEAERQRAELFFEKNGCYSPCNMLVARKKVLSDLCEWLFPILLEVVDCIGELEDPYQNRYPGFLSERLISFYFYEHSAEYKIAYADKNFLQ